MQVSCLYEDFVPCRKFGLAIGAISVAAWDKHMLKELCQRAKGLKG